MKEGTATAKDKGSRHFSGLIDLLRFPLAVLVVAIPWNFTIRYKGYLPFYDECTEGAAQAVQKGELLVLRHQCVALLHIPCVVADFLLRTSGLAEGIRHPVLLLCGAGIVVGAFALAALVQQRTHWRWPRDFTAATMFIYGWHNLHLFGPEYLLFRGMDKAGVFAWCNIGSPAALVYMLVPPVLEALAGVYVYKLLRRYLPRVSAFLSGGK